MLRLRVQLPGATSGESVALAHPNRIDTAALSDIDRHSKACEVARHWHAVELDYRR